jgi:alpha-tubulin suppressor-like RCC1 family protein
VAIAAGGYHTVGLKTDGTVIAVGDNSFEQCDASSWTDIEVVTAGSLHTIGLKADGTVVAIGDDFFDQCDVSSWMLKAGATGMSLISAENTQIIGYYSITGQYLPQEPQSGSYIVVYDNGKTEKRMKVKN